MAVYTAVWPIALCQVLCFGQCETSMTLDISHLLHLVRALPAMETVDIGFTDYG